jgi:hypothetical protein
MSVKLIRQRGASEAISAPMALSRNGGVATFHVRKGVARRQGLGLSILNERESVVAGVDGRTAYTRIS